MGFLDLVRSIAALLVTLGLMGAIVVLLKKFGPQWLERMRAAQGPRRLAMIESLMLDPTRRLVLVRLDGEEKLILLGEGRILEQRP